MISLRSIALAVLAVGLSAIGTAGAGDPTGTWLTENGRSKVTIANCGGALCGTIVWLKEPNDPATGKPKTDVHNSDAAKQSRPLLGVAIVLGMKPSGTADKWVGEVYNPEDGRTYSGSITLKGTNQLDLQGCALGIFCKTQTWSRAS